MRSELLPTTFEALAATLSAATAEGQSVRIRGGGTKLEWGNLVVEPQVELNVGGLDEIVEHNAGDMTLVAQAGAPLARIRELLAENGQMLALDPPLGIDSPDATIGGVIATADSGPLRHRYGGPRDLVLGVTVALSDGTIVRAGGKVIKNVAGYDLGKLFAGSFGTLGVMLSVCMRLHPLPSATATALGSSSDPTLISDASRTVAAAPLELEALDLAWRDGRGELLARCAGVESVRRAERHAGMMRAAGLEQVDVVAADEALWERQRAGQRSRSLALLRVLVRPSGLGAVLAAVDASGAALVGRAALGLCFIELDPDVLHELRAALPPGAITVLLDVPAALRDVLDPWGAQEGPALELMRRIKARFDPGGTCNPGVFVGGI